MIDMYLLFLICNFILSAIKNEKEKNCFDLEANLPISLKKFSLESTRNYLECLSLGFSFKISKKTMKRDRYPQNGTKNGNPKK